MNPWAVHTQAPMEQGVVEDWAAMETIWHEILVQMGLPGCVGNGPEGVLMTEVHRVAVAFISDVYFLVY